MEDTKRIAKNTIYLYLRMFFVLVVSLYTSRVVLNTLGVTDYGIYNVVAGFVSLFSFINATLSSSLQRYYNYEGIKNETLGFNNVYNVGLAIHIILSIVLLIILETLGVWYVNNIMILPSDRLPAANCILQTSIFSLLLVLLQIPYIGAIMAKERMNYYAIVSIVDTSLKLAVVFFLPRVDSDHLVIYGWLLLTINLFDLIAYYVYCHLKFSEISLNFKYDLQLFKAILGFSGWNIIGTFAFLIKGQGVNLLLNFFFGPIVNAARGIAFQVNNAVSSFSQNISIAFRPQITNMYATNQKESVQKLMFVESKVCFMLIAVIMIPIIIDIDYILQLWLGENVPELTASFVTLVLVDTLIGTLNTPCTQVVQATGNIKLYQIFSTAVNIILIPASWLLLKWGFQASSVFIAAIVVSVLNQLLCLVATHMVFQFNYNKYISQVIIPCCLFITLLPVVPYALSVLCPQSFARLLCIVVADLFMALLLFYLLGLDATQKKDLVSYVLNKFRIHV